MRSIERWGIGVAVVGVLAGTAQAWEIPLTVEEYWGRGGTRYVSGGVPLLVGQAREISGLRLAVRGSNGSLRAVPAQFRVLARWWRADNSIRWVLVDFVTDIGPNQKQAFVLTDAQLKAPAPADTLTVEETGETISVTTGPARFVVNRTRFAFLDHAFVDGNGDGRFAADEDLLATTADCGTVIEDAFGRVRVRARGTHRARDGKGYSKGMYSYDYFMDFYAGATTVFVDLIIGNNPPTSVGTPTFEDASLVLKVRGGLDDYTVAGDKTTHAGALAAGQSVCLYQDSNGANTWNQCQGYNTEQRDYWRYPEGRTASFRGYKVWRRAGGKEEEIAAGEQAVGTTRVRNERGGIVLHLLNFWQQFPKGVEVAADGTVRLALFPREYKVVHFLEDATAKGHEIVLHFYARGRGGAPADPPVPAAIAGRWDSRAYPRPPLEHICATGALADLGPYTVPTQGLDQPPNNRTAANDPRMLTTDGLYGNAYGWQVLGERWRSCGGHSTRGARQPMNEDNYLFRWYVTGLRGWLAAGDNRSRQFRDVRAYRIDDQDPFGFKDWDDFRAHNRSEDWTRRPQPTDPEARKYSEGRYPRSTFWLPNPAHMVMDLVYDRYLLMGDQRSFENMYTIAAHGGYYAAYRPAQVHRDHAWCWRTLFRYWELTGNTEAERLLKLTIQNHRRLMAQSDVKLPWKKDRNGADVVIWWWLPLYGRAAAMTALATRDPDALSICKRYMGVVEDRSEKDPGAYSAAAFAEVNGVLWHLTGDARYRTRGLGKDDDERLKRAPSGMALPASGHWLLHRPPEVLREG